MRLNGTAKSSVAAAVAGAAAIISIAVVIVVIVTLGFFVGGARAQPGGSETSATIAPPSPAPSAAAPAQPAPRAPTVRIVFKIYPPNRAMVSWGKKKLGLIKPKAPLIIERPRDSGPLDVVVRADGCVPVHTRAYTFTDSVVAVKITPLDKKNTIYGYREELPPEPDGGAPSNAGNPDGGVAPSP